MMIDRPTLQMKLQHKTAKTQPMRQSSRIRLVFILVEMKFIDAKSFTKFNEEMWKIMDACDMSRNNWSKQQIIYENKWASVFKK